MKKRLKILCGGMVMGLSGAISLYGYEPLPPHLDGTMMTYEFSSESVVPAWNDSLTVVKGVYVARHGARYLSSSKKTENIIRLLRDADAKGELTPRGLEFLNLAIHVDSISSGKWGELSQVGIEEEKKLGEELAALCPELIESGKVTGKATYVPRVVMTMYEFAHSLALASKSVEVSTSEGRQYNSLLRFFDTDTIYNNYIKNGEWKRIVEDYKRAHISLAPAKRLFKQSARHDAGFLRGLTMEMYALLQGLRASGAGVPDTRWMSLEEYRQCWELDNMEHYYPRTATDLSGVAAEAAVPLLLTVVGDMIDGATPQNVNMYFGHAETVMPLFSLMGLPGCYAPEMSPEFISEGWRDWEVSPLGANLLVVILLSGSGNRYAAVRLNGKFLPPLPGDSRKVVPLYNLSGYWLERASAFSHQAP